MDVEATLDRDGFAVLDGLVASTRLPDLADLYDTVVREATAPRLAIGRTTTRVHGLADLSEFAALAASPLILRACRSTIGKAFSLSSLLARTLHSGAAAQNLHVDCARDDPSWPMVGFILMIDGFRSENGATRFVPGSHRASNGVETVAACGPAGSLIIYNGSVLHGHGANTTDRARRSIQGAYVRKDA